VNAAFKGITWPGGSKPLFAGVAANERSDAQNLKGKVREPKREPNRKDKTPAETAALLVLQKKAQHHLGKQRGQLTMSSHRKMIITGVNEAMRRGAHKDGGDSIVLPLDIYLLPGDRAVEDDDSSPCVRYTK
jgi:hypothetical protein